MHGKFFQIYSSMLGWLLSPQLYIWLDFFSHSFLQPDVKFCERPHRRRRLFFKIQPTILNIRFTQPYISSYVKGKFDDWYRTIIVNLFVSPQPVMSQPYPVPIPIPQPKSRPLPDSRGIPDSLISLAMFAAHHTLIFGVNIHLNPCNIFWFAHFTS